tara:strand:+ start:1242 stop:4193 length:2952 start_codon:yes stop_codon:yes gene_type:complete
MNAFAGLKNDRKSRTAFTLIALMLTSLMLAGVVAEVADGDGTTGIDRNPNPQEQDTTKPTQTVDAVTGYSKLDMLIANGNTATPGTDKMDYASITDAWTIAGDQSQGWMDTTRANVTVSNTESTEIVISNKVDGTNGQAITMTLKNWYGTIDRSSPATVGSTPAQNAKTDGCDNVVANPAGSNGVMTCILNADGGISPELPTMLALKSSQVDGTLSYGIMGGNDSRNNFFGIDYETSYTHDVYVNGVKVDVGGSKAVHPTDTLELRCNTNSCTEDVIEIGVPGAYNGTGADFTNGLDKIHSDDVYNTTSRIGVYSNKIVKLTFGLADSNDDGVIDDEANMSGATAGVFYDPAIRFVQDEPGIRIGSITDGGATWCDFKWFLADCSDLSLDGNASDGIDGMMMKVNIPMEAVYGLASWGGFDKAEMILTHNIDSCFNGDIRTYVLTESQFDASVSKNNWLTYLTSGDYYSMSALPANGFNSATSYGSSAVDYCTGPSYQPETKIEIDRIAQMTQNSLYYEHQQGFYDIMDEVFSFYVVIAVEESTHADATDLIKFDPEMAMFSLEHTNAYDPLADQASINIYRSTNSTNQTNPAHASPYVLYYSGITPSDNVVAGRNTSGIAGGTADDFGPRYQGTQTVGNEVRKAAQFVQLNNTPLSTIECGLAGAGVAMVSSQIEIFTNTDTSLYEGAGQNGSGFGPQTTWKEYGTLSTNSSIWTMGATSSSNTGATVDNDEVNTASNSVSFTGVFINGDTYKAKCTMVYKSADVQANNFTTTTVTYETLFTAAYDGEYVGSGGGSDVDDEESEGWIDDLSGWDLIIIGLAIAIIGLGLYMFATGPKWGGWFDDRTAMILFGVGWLHAWVSHHFSESIGGSNWLWGDAPLSDDTAMIVGTLGFLVMAASIYLYGGGTTSQSERNFRYGLGGLFITIVGVPSAITGLLGIENELLEEAMWAFPIYEAISAIGAVLGILLLTASAVSLYRREGM